MADAPPRSASSFDLRQGLYRSALAGVVTFLLLLPLIGFDTVQNIRNELVLETRWGLLRLLTSIVVVGSFLWSIARSPWGRARLATLPSRPGKLLWIGLGNALIAIAVLVLGDAFASPVDKTTFLQITAFFIVVAAISFGFWVVFARRSLFRRLRETYPAVDHFARFVAERRAMFLVGFVAVYPFVALALSGFQGAAKWIDNFGIQILIYVMLGWGLNIVVGLAGLLDLGYVAFYAVGAYSYALLAKTFGLSFWILFPLAGCLASFWGILLGFPVLRLRGDYLAIVTLAFGEIIRIVIINWVGLTNGYAGITGIPRPSFFGIPFTADADGFAAVFGLEFRPIYRTIFLYYVILVLALLTSWLTLRVRALPIGRAWEALREDEIACRSLGINTVTTKLTAFAMGAAVGGIAGSFFAARQGFISPESFTFMESAVIVAMVVLGGMGSQIGVAIAAIVMIGGTEIMRDLDVLKVLFSSDFDPAQYRMLLFGFAMVVIMIWKPRGLISTREPTVFLKERKAIDATLVQEGHG